MTPRFEVDKVERRHLELAKGAVLFRQGDPSDYVYVVDSGRLQVSLERDDGSEEQLATVGPGQFVGELGPLLGLQRSATVRADAATVLTAHTATEFRSRVQGVPAAIVVPARAAKPPASAAKKPPAKQAPAE
jgi:CRP-like cAMP-binding protein